MAGEQEDPGRQAQRPPSLVVGYKDGPECVNALRFAIGLATELNASIHIVHVIDLADYPLDPDDLDWEEQAERSLDQEQIRVRTVMGDHPGEWTYRSCRGNPLKLLREAAAEHGALMVVVGTHSDGPGASLARLFGGSVSHGLVRHLHHPVLVVPLTAEPY